jgi:potassium efflux system protein
VRFSGRLVTLVVMVLIHSPFAFHTQSVLAQGEGVPGGRELRGPVNPLRAPDPTIAAPPAATAPLAVPEIQPPPQVDEVSAAEPVKDAAETPSEDVAPVVPTEVPTPTIAAELTGSISVERLSQQIKQLKDATDVADDVKTELLKRYQACLELLQNAEEARRKIAQYQAEMDESSQRIEQVRSQLATALPDVTTKSYEDKNLQERETLLAESEGRLVAARAKLAEREAELKNRAERKAELTKKIEEAKQRLVDAEQTLAAPPVNTDSVVHALVARTELEARHLFLQQQLELLQSELRRSDKLTELFPLQKDLALRETNLAEKEVTYFQTLVNQARRRESERQAQEARRQAESADPAIRDLADGNALLAEQRKQLAAKITQASGELRDLQKLIQGIEEDYERAKEKVVKAGRSTTVGLMLRRKHDQLPRLSHCEERQHRIERETPLIYLEQMKVEDEREPLGDIDAVKNEIMRKLDEQLNSMHGEHLQLTVAELLNTRRDLLDKLNDELESYLLNLIELDSANQDLIIRVTTFREFIGENVLWIRSAEPLGKAHFHDAARAVVVLSDPRAWFDVVRGSGLEMIREPMIGMGVAAAVLLLVMFHTQLRNRIKTLCEAKSNTAGWRFLPLIRALLLTAIVSAEASIVVWFIGWRMSHAHSELAQAVGPALQYTAFLHWLSSFLRLLCRRDGVAEAYFNWPASSLRSARHALRWLTWLGLPLAGIVMVAHAYGDEEWADSLGRLAFVASMLLLACFAHATLGRKNNIFREAIGQDVRCWLNRMRLLAYSSGLSIALMLTLLACVGYYYSAKQLAVRFQATLGMGLAILLVHAVASRWFLVKRRKLAMQQARERQQQQASQENDGVSNNNLLSVKEETDWAAVHDRLRLLLRQAITVSVVFGAWFIWADVLPALKVLDHVELWTQTVTVQEPIGDVAGLLTGRTINAAPISSHESVVSTTLRHALIAGVALLVTFLLGKNLPALLEFTILNRLPLDRGGRHAVSIILHYTVAMSGMLIALRTLHINWGSIQWLAAAMTVGLGFGLQEIFANFVSGMILLFERPIRVGDIITLGDVTGTVTDIRIRATTVTNWDRKELIVPNKDLITGRLLNWTLSDTTNRIVINVGLAYQSDADLARRLLQEVVVQHHNVLEDPAPNVTFESFGESTLNFVIRAYLANLDVRLETVHELHAGIHRRLREAGIEIAFPQRDINIRNISLPAQMFTTESLRRPDGGKADAVTRRNEAA